MFNQRFTTILTSEPRKENDSLKYFHRVKNE